MVKTWWIAGESWYVDGHFCGAKNMPRILDLFLVIPVSGMSKRQKAVPSVDR
jgi:hypothetical protein